MKNSLMLALLIVMVTATITNAQSLPADSINKGKEQQRIAEITKRLDNRKQKLVVLENEFLEQTNKKERAVNEVQESADKNKRAAVKLSNDPQDKKKAKRAEKQSDDARRDAKKARRVSNNLEGVEDDIKQIKKRIAEDEKLLADLKLRKSGQ
ncbi:hypothetical protein [Paraflavitalea sp. CAU 1676]|uniref:hypothetical protein n=1 Tax=Paraflavitalea sp. CAU 1676 TaxID=3032598 RepID=UPI0023DC4F22|nr:hypothetical protein [Paraflavitalea sp. CAU 1676]MDF2191272.1 hypothetical protein [Paraflavitalea sp. CAU 1676]